MIGHLIPEDDAHWKVFILYLETLDYILAPSLNIGEIKFMKELIDNCMRTFYNLNNSLSVRPKSHYILHYSTQFLRFGPLIHNMTLRYEGLHAKMKATMKRVKNFKNPCLTMANRYQYLQCFHHLADTYLADGNLQYPEKQQKIQINSMSKNDYDAVTSIVTNLDYLILWKSVTSDGITYSSGMCIVMGWKNDTYEFGKITSITNFQEKVYLLGNIMITEDYNPHIHSYSVSQSKTSFFLKLSDLLSPFPLSTYPNKTEFNIPVRHHVQNPNQSIV